MPEPHRIAGATFNGDRSNILSFKVPWIVYTEEQLASFKPPEAPLGLPIVDRSATQDNGDWVLTLTYEGVKPGATVEETFELDGGTSEDPIESHPDWEALKKKYKAIMDGEKFDGWPAMVNTEYGKVKNPMLGVSAFLNTSAVWRRGFGDMNFPADLLRELGCVDRPRGKIQPPSLPEGRNWLKRSIKATWRGNIWTINEEWLASGRGGWNRDIYKVR